MGYSTPDPTSSSALYKIYGFLKHTVQGFPWTFLSQTFFETVEEFQLSFLRARASKESNSASIKIDQDIEYKGTIFQLAIDHQ